MNETELPYVHTSLELLSALTKPLGEFSRLPFHGARSGLSGLYLGCLACWLEN